MNQANEAESDQWIVLSHTAGPGVDGSIFGDPRFAHHRAFLASVAERGWLVAAGPLSDVGAEGMTVLRVQDPDEFAEAVRMAEADRSVVEGLFTLRVRPWQVVTTG